MPRASKGPGSSSLARRPLASTLLGLAARHEGSVFHDGLLSMHCLVIISGLGKVCFWLWREFHSREGGTSPTTCLGSDTLKYFLTLVVRPPSGTPPSCPQPVPARRVPLGGVRHASARGPSRRSTASGGGGTPPQTHRELETRTNSAGFKPSAARPSHGGWPTSPAPAQPPAPRRAGSVEPSAVPVRACVPEIQPEEAP